MLSVLSNKIRPHPYICSQHVIWAIADDYHIAIETVTVQTREDSSGHVCQEQLYQHGYLDLNAHCPVDREFSCHFVVWLEVHIVDRFLVIETMTKAVSWYTYRNFQGTANLKPVLSGILRENIVIPEMFVGQQPTPSKSHLTQCQTDRCGAAGKEVSMGRAHGENRFHHMNKYISATVPQARSGVFLGPCTFLTVGHSDCLSF